MKSLCVCADSAKCGSARSSGDVCCSRSINSDFWFSPVFLCCRTDTGISSISQMFCFQPSDVGDEDRKLLEKIGQFEPIII